MSVSHKNLKKCKSQETLQQRKSLSSFIIFKEKENKFQIDYQKILKFRDDNCL